MNRFLIINADDFGYSYSINKGIIEAYKNGIVTSTSVMVDAIAASEARYLIKYPDLSIGLHLELSDATNVEAELKRQIEAFITIVGHMPDHIDTHKRHTTDDFIREALEDYTHTHKIPVRNFNAKHICSFGVSSKDASVAQLKRSVDEATDKYNELMTHCGYSDDYLRAHSTYNDPREQELQALCTPEIKRYIADKGLALINWKQVSNI